MKKLSLLLLLLAVGFTSLAAGAPSRATFPQDGNYIYHRVNGAAMIMGPEELETVPQSGLFEFSLIDDGQVVTIKNIVYGSETTLGDYWVQAQISYTDLTITVPMGQLVYYDRGRRAVLTWGTLHYDASTKMTSFTRDASVTEATYHMDGNTIHIDNTTGPVGVEAQDDVSYDATGIGIVWEDDAAGEDEYYWGGYCEWETEAIPCITQTELPEGELKTYKRTSDCIHFADIEYGLYYSIIANNFSTEALSDKGQIIFADDGKTVYLKDPVLSMSYDTWVTGTLSDDTITVPIPQFIKSYSVSSTVQIDKGLSEIRTSDRSEDYLFINNDEYNKVVNYLIDGNTIRMLGTSANLDADYPNNYNAGGFIVYDPVTGQGALEANIVYTLDESPVEPTEKTASPTFRGYTEDGIYAYFVEILPTEPSTIYYRVQYPDGHFSEWTQYDGILSFTNAGNYRVEAYAQATDKLVSETIAYEFELKEVPVTNINELAGNKQIAGVRYYNVMGQEIQQPNGMTVVVTTYTDGTTSTVKVVK